MKTILKFIPILLIIAILVSTTAFAYTDEELEYGFVAGEVIIAIKPEYNDLESYEELFPEIEIDKIGGIIKLQAGYALQVILVEKTCQAVLDAIEALENNPNIRYMHPNDILTIDKGQPSDPDDDMIQVEIEFLPGGIHVGIKPEYNNLESYEELFSEINIESVELTEEMDAGNLLKIVLKEKTEEAVLEAIEKLKENECVRFACKYATKGRIVIIKGDATEDGEVTNSDVVTIARSVVGAVELTETQALNADMNDDGVVSNPDVVVIARNIVGL